MDSYTKERLLYVFVILAIATVITTVLFVQVQRIGEQPSEMQAQENTLYMVCDFWGNPELCETSNIVAGVHADQNNITFQTLAYNSTLGEKLLNETVQYIPLFVYNTPATTPGEYCYMFGETYELQMIQEFTEQCEATGKYVAPGTTATNVTEEQ